MEEKITLCGDNCIELNVKDAEYVMLENLQVLVLPCVSVYNKRRLQHL